MPRCLAIALTLLLTTSPVQAWSRGGHMVSAVIAYDLLERDKSDKLARVLEALKLHPDFAERWEPLLAKVPADDRDMFLFALAARWPDDVRRTKQHRSAWHYINIPFKPDGQPDGVKAKPHTNPSILFAFTENMEQIKAKETTNGDKAIALCWVFTSSGTSISASTRRRCSRPNFPMVTGAGICCGSDRRNAVRL